MVFFEPSQHVLFNRELPSLKFTEMIVKFGTTFSVAIGSAMSHTRSKV